MSEEKGSRYNKGKPQLSLVLEAPHALKGAAEVLTFGLVKYSRGNWKKGLSWTDTVDSLSRHLLDFQNGVDFDAETGKPMVDHILCNALFLSEFYHTNTGTDDRTSVPSTVTALDDSWVKWYGGECPVSDDTIVEVLFRSGVKNKGAAKYFRWDIVTVGGDIVAYRVIKEEKG